jgi:hypothetical protein
MTERVAAPFAWGPLSNPVRRRMSSPSSHPDCRSGIPRSTREPAMDIKCLFDRDLLSHPPHSGMCKGRVDLRTLTPVAEPAP